MSTVERRCFAVIPAAGTGSRMGLDVPKQYLEIEGHTLLEHALMALVACEEIGAICVALHAEDTRASTLPTMSDPRVRSTIGAAERSGSVLAGLQALADVADDSDWVLVHDAARPCLRQSDIANLMQKVGATGVGGILAEPLVDTVKEVDAAALVQRTLDRSQLWRAQTPQMFRIGELREALNSASANGAVITDEASAMELAGHSVQIIPCASHNMKVTVPVDIELAAFYLSRAATAEIDVPAQDT